MYWPCSPDYGGGGSPDDTMDVNASLSSDDDDNDGDFRVETPTTALSTSFLCLPPRRIDKRTPKHLWHGW